MSVTRRALPHLLFAASLALVITPAGAKAPGSTDVMRPVETTAGAIHDPQKLLQVNMDRVFSVSLTNVPAEIVFNQIGGMMGIAWGFMPGVDKSKPVTLVQVGPGRDMLKALGDAAQVRFEVTGPTQMRVFPARTAAPAPKKTTPPPVKRDTE